MATGHAQGAGLSAKQVTGARASLAALSVVVAALGLVVVGHVVYRPGVPPVPPPSGINSALGAASTPTATTPSASQPPSRTPLPTPTGSTPGPTAVPARLAGVDWTVIPTSRRVVALTFDDGDGDGDGLDRILATLAEEDIKATFFPTGEFAAARPNAVQAIVARGHLLGNHSATHPHFMAISDSQIRRELSEAERMIRAAGGGDLRPLFRFPYGERTTHAIAVVNQAEYACVRWSIDTNGWRGTTAGITVAGIVATVVAGARAGCHSPHASSQERHRRIHAGR